MTQKKHPQIKAIWERFLDYELGHLQLARNVLKEVMRRIRRNLSLNLPEQLGYQSNREYVREVLREEVDLCADDPRFANKTESSTVIHYRHQIYGYGSPSDIVSAEWQWSAGGELLAQRWLKEAA